jgi:hypothetical protein
MGLDPRASGPTTGVPGAESAALRRIRKLLALAESPNQHEAEAAMKAAHRMMLQHNVDIEARRAAEGYGVRHIGPARARHAAWETLLISLLSRHFFVRIVWVPVVDRTAITQRYDGIRLKRMDVAEALGTPENLEIAEYVYDFLAQTGERLWQAHRRAAGLKGNRERQRFLSGVMVGFRKKLDEGVEAAAREGLVWVGAAGLDDFVKRRFPRLVHGTGVTVVRSAEFMAGQEAGRTIVLHKPIRSTGSGSRTSLLG